MSDTHDLPETSADLRPRPRPVRGARRRPSARAARRLERRRRRSARSGRERLARLARGLVAATAVCVVLGLAGLLGVRAFLAHELSQLQNFDQTADTTDEGAPLALPEAAGEVETFLVFSTGSAGLTQAEADRLGVAGLEERGEDNLTDVLMLVVVDPRVPSARVLSIPRDTYRPERGYRINSVFRRDGAQALADEVRELTGVPVNHLVSVDFRGFATVTDEVGGVDVRFPRPTRDTFSGLLVETAGCAHLDGRDALAFVRSRHTQVRVEGRWRTAPSATDFGRIQRQQVFISSLLGKLIGPELPLRVPALLRVARRDVVIDQNLTVDDLTALARAFTSSSPDAVRYLSLPAYPDRVRGAEVLRVDRDRAPAVLDEMRRGVPGAEPISTPSPVPAETSPQAETSPSPESETSPSPEVTVPTPSPSPTLRGYEPC